MKGIYRVFILFSVAICLSCSHEDNLSQAPNVVRLVDSVDVSMQEILSLGSKPSSLQGLAVYEDCCYQFYTNGRCRIYNLLDGKLKDDVTLPGGHYGSTVFNEFEDTEDGLPFLYVGGSMDCKEKEGYVVVNMNSREIDRVIEFDKPCAKQVLCAFNFVTGIGYSFGYKDNDLDHEVAPYEVTPFDIETGKCDIVNRFYVKNEGHLQDAVFDKGKIWICTGWNTQWNGADIPVKVVGIDVAQKATTTILNLGFLNHEAEGIDIWGGKFMISMRKVNKVYEVSF